MKRQVVWAAFAVLAMTTATLAGPLAGAIFTTVEDGSRVNANIYDAREDVYLDGGPGDQAPAGAAALPAGDYYFQVTEPAGKVLLSEDPIFMRRVRVSDDGVIVAASHHATGVDVDHAAQGALTVQLMPYAETPNNGGVYKVWMTPVRQYRDGRGNFGFIHSWSKTDVFKVRTPDEPEPPCDPYDPCDPCWGGD